MEGWKSDMKQATWAGIRTILLAVMALFLLPLQTQTERNWEFSVSAFESKAFHFNEDLKINGGVGNAVITGTAF